MAPLAIDMHLLLRLACPLAAAAVAAAHGPEPASSAPAEAFETMREHGTCGSCIAAGGAWCLAGMQKCVPDGREMCGVGGPGDMVGWAGRGRCPDPVRAPYPALPRHRPTSPAAAPKVTRARLQEEWKLQAYLHAPRRPPAPALQKPAPPDCRSTCAADLARGAPTDAARLLTVCGVAVLGGVFEPAALARMREQLVVKLKLAAGGPQYGHKMEMPGVRGDGRQELVLPSKLAVRFPSLPCPPSPPPGRPCWRCVGGLSRSLPAAGSIFVADGGGVRKADVLPALGQPAVLSVLAEMLGHPPAVDFATVRADSQF